MVRNLVRQGTGVSERAGSDLKRRLVSLWFIPLLLILCRPVLAQTARLVTFPLIAGPYQYSTMTRVVPGVASGAYLWMQTYNLSWAGKMSVRLNGGAWVVLNNTNCQVQGNAKQYGGIGGLFETLDFRIPTATIGSISNTVNTLDFKVGELDGNSSTIYILDFDFLNSGGTRLLPSSALAYDNPATYIAPSGYGTPAQIAAGKTLFTTRDLLRSSNIRGNVAIHAACSDCHTDSGAVPGLDLAAFNYRNDSIIDRSIFHGLNVDQGSKIAGYIRSLSRYKTVNGRPWGPVFQPAVGLDSLPVKEWGVGGGVNTILRYDKDMIPYLFPSGITLAAVSYTATLNMRQLPVSLPLQSWNHWLPTTWPGDSFSDFLPSTLSTIYENGSTGIEDRLASASAQTYLNNGLIKTLFGNWATAINQYLGSQSNSVHQMIVNATTPALKRTAAKAIYSTGQWMQAKTWGLMNADWISNTVNLSENPQYFFSPPYEVRAWPPGGSLFQTSPGKRGIPYGWGTFDIDLPSGAIPETGVLYEGSNNQWYWDTIVTDAGNRLGKSGDHNPIDWPYMRGRVKDLSVATMAVTGGTAGGIWEGCRATAMGIKADQQGAGVIPPGIPANSPTSNGWSILPYGRIDTLIEYNVSGFPTAYQDVGSFSAAQQKAIIGVLMQNITNLSNQFAPSAYYGTNSISTTATTPCQTIGQVNFPGSIKLMMQYARTLGVTNTQANPLADWAATVWTANGQNWSSLKY